MNHKRRRAKNARSGFRMNGKTVYVKSRDLPTQERKARISDRETVKP